MHLLHIQPHAACSVSLCSFTPELRVLLPSSRPPQLPGRHAHTSLLPKALRNPFPGSQGFPATRPPPSSRSSPSSSHPPLATSPPPVPTPAYLVPRTALHIPSRGHRYLSSPLQQSPHPFLTAYPKRSRPRRTPRLPPQHPGPAHLCAPAVSPTSRPTSASSPSPAAPGRSPKKVPPSPPGTRPQSSPRRTQRLSSRSSPGTHLRARRSQRTASSAPLRTQQPLGLRYGSVPSPQPSGQPEAPARRSAERGIACTSPQPHTPIPPRPPARRASPRRRPAAAHPQPAGGALPPAPNSQTLGGRRPSPGGG